MNKDKHKSTDHQDEQDVEQPMENEVVTETEASETEASETEVNETPATDAGTDELQRQVDELTEALQRERADAMNLRRRHQDDMAALKSRVKTNVVRDLLPVIDNLERALKHVPEDLRDNDYVKGVQGVVKQFEKTLGDMGVERIKTVGEPFDPHYHEAVSMEDGDGDQEIVSDELQSGFHIDGDVVRHAMVRVRQQ